MKALLSFIFLSSVLVTHSVWADDIHFGTPAYGGNGCPIGSMSIALSPDMKTVSFVFDPIVAQAGATFGVDRKNCDVALPVHVPQGLSIAMGGMTFRGFNNLPQGAKSELNLLTFFAGSAGPVFRKTFTGPLHSDYLISVPISAEAMVWSPCGADTNIRFNSSIVARTNALHEDAIMTIDRIENFQLQYRKCGPAPLM